MSEYLGSAYKTMQVSSRKGKASHIHIGFLSPMASHNSVKILEVCPVTPLPSSLDSATTTSLPLTFFDILWLRFPPNQRVFFYETSNTNTPILNSILPKLKHSLSHTPTLPPSCRYAHMASGFQQTHYKLQGGRCSFTHYC